MGGLWGGGGVGAEGGAVDRDILVRAHTGILGTIEGLSPSDLKSISICVVARKTFELKSLPQIYLYLRLTNQERKSTGCLTNGGTKCI